MKKLFVILISLFLLVSCDFGRKKEKSNFENNQFITDIQDGISYKKRDGGSSFRIIDDAIKSSFAVSYLNFNGTETVWIIEVKTEGEIELYFTSKTIEGRVKGVLITPQNIVANVFSGNIKDGIKIGLKEGYYRIKLVGEKFEGKVNMTLIGKGDIMINGKK